MCYLLSVKVCETCLSSYRPSRLTKSPQILPLRTGRRTDCLSHSHTSDYSNVKDQPGPHRPFGPCPKAHRRSLPNPSMLSRSLEPASGPLRSPLTRQLQRSPLRCVAPACGEGVVKNTSFFQPVKPVFLFFAFFRQRHFPAPTSLSGPRKKPRLDPPKHPPNNLSKNTGCR